MFRTSNLLSFALITVNLFSLTAAVPVDAAHAVKITTDDKGQQPPRILVKEIVETKTITHKVGCAAAHAPTGHPEKNSAHHGKTPGGGGSQNRGGGNGRGPRLNPRVLAPAVHPNVNRRDPGNLRTCIKLDLYYGEPSYSQNTSTSTNSSMAVVQIPHLKYPAVELMSSEYVSNVACNATSAKITFNNYEAYSVAASNWTQQAGRFVMISAFGGCRNAAPDLDNEYIIVDKVITDDAALTIQAEITHSDFEEVVGADTIVTVNLGIYSPDGGNGFSATATSESTFASIASSTSNSAGGRPGLDGFDDALDRAEGSTIAIDDVQYQQQLFPGLETTSLTRRDLKGFSEAELGMAYRRGLFDWFKTVADTIVKGTVEFFTETIPTVLTEPLPDLIEDAIDWIETESVKVADALGNFVSLNKDYPSSIAIDYYPSNSHFEIAGVNGELPAYQLYDSENIKAYCVQCGADGQVTITGTVAFSISKGFTSGKIGADGNLRGTVALGLAGTVSQNFSIPEQHLVTVALSDLVLGSLVQIGPAISLAAGADLTLSAAGELLAGVTLDWPAFSASLDIINQESHASGFQPNIEPIFQAAGRISASTDIYSLISLQFTVSVLAGQFRTSVALVDRPGVLVSAGIAGQARYNNGSVSGGFTGDCVGVGISANIYNRLYVDVLDLYRADLHHWESGALETCIAFTQSKRQLAGQRRATIGERPSSHRRSEDNLLTVILSSANGALNLRYASNGNIYAIPSTQGQDETMLFSAQRLASTSGNSTVAGAGYNATTPAPTSPRIVFGTADSRVLHGYRSELDTWGVSRLRIADPYEMPRQSVVMALGEVPVPAAAAVGMLRRDGGQAFGGKVVMATDTNGEVLWPVLCNFEGLFSKVFLVKDLERGVRTLMSEEVKGRLVEEEVRLMGCGYMPFAIRWSVTL